MLGRATICPIPLQSDNRRVSPCKLKCRDTCIASWGLCGEISSRLTLVFDPLYARRDVAMHGGGVAGRIHDVRGCGRMLGGADLGGDLAGRLSPPTELGVEFSVATLDAGCDRGMNVYSHQRGNLFNFIMQMKPQTPEMESR